MVSPRSSPVSLLDPVSPPADAAQRRSAPAIIAYEVQNLPKVDTGFYERARAKLTKTGEVIVPPRDGATFEVLAGHLFRIVLVEGPQVRDLNLWKREGLKERFFSGRRASFTRTK